MSQNLKIWKISLLLLLGLLVSLYLIAGTVADVYWIVTNPVAGAEYEFDKNMGRMVVRSVVPKGPADQGGLRPGDVILIFDRKPIISQFDLDQAYREIKVGQEVEITVKRGNNELELSFVAERSLNVYGEMIFLHLLPGAFFCYTLSLIGVFVFLKKIQERSAQIFYLMLLFWALAIRDALKLGPVLDNLLPHWFAWLDLPAWPLAIGTLLHFFLLFPVEKRALQKRATLLLILIYSPLILIVPFIYADVQQLPWREHLLSRGWGIWLTLNFIAAMIVLDHSIRKAPNPHIKKQAQIMAWGTTLSLAVPLCFYWLPKLLFDQELPWGEFAAYLLTLWPITLAYVIVKHRFMDIDVMVKRGVAYALTSGIVVAAYFLLVVGVGKLVLYFTGYTSQLVTIIATVLIAALFNPVKNKIQNFVNHRFYPNRFLYREAIQAFGRELVNVVDLQKLMELLKAFFLETMQIRPVALLLHQKEEEIFAVHTIAGAEINNPPQFRRLDKVIQRLRDRQRLVDLSPLKEQPEPLPEDEIKRWQALEAELVLPLLSQGELAGIITLGMKEGDEPYYKEDLEMLAALSNQINVAFKNTLLTEELREQDRLRRELEVARRIQLRSLPQADPAYPGLQISGVSIPALEVGGDYYDYIILADGRLGVVVGDVSGKGTSAAFYMSTLKGILKTAAKYHRSLRDLVVEVNAIAYQSMELQSYITLMCGAYDVRDRKLSLVRAGHLPLLHYSARERACRQLVPKGIGVGLEIGPIFGTELEEIEVPLIPGDVFLFYTDGITEARDALGHEFETERLIQTVQENGWEDAPALREKIISQVQAFARETSQKDDMTVVVVKVGAID
jgi:sigma-B regulation protein RsbU (phosphoserine phosphatase)